MSLWCFALAGEIAARCAAIVRSKQTKYAWLAAINYTPFLFSFFSPPKCMQTFCNQLYFFHYTPCQIICTFRGRKQRASLGEACTVHRTTDRPSRTMTVLLNMLKGNLTSSSLSRWTRGVKRKLRTSQAKGGCQSYTSKTTMNKFNYKMNRVLNVPWIQHPAFCTVLLNVYVYPI